MRQKPAKLLYVASDSQIIQLPTTIIGQVLRERRISGLYIFKADPGARTV
jgi:hypothetical protein